MKHDWPPTTPELGHLRIDEVFVEFDGPRLFSCANRMDQLFLFLSVEESDEMDGWVVVPVSRPRLSRAFARQIDLYDLFAHPEEGFAFRFNFYDRRHTYSLERCPSSELTEEFLPERGTFLSRPLQSSYAHRLIDVEALSHQSRRHVSALRIGMPSHFQHQIPVRDLSAILSPLQEIYSSLDPQYRPERKSKGGRVPPALLPRSELQVGTIGAGSVLVILEGREAVDMFGATALDEIADRFRSLLECKSEPALLRAQIDAATPKTARSYGALLRAMVRAGVSIEVTSASPSTEARSPVKLTAAEAAAAIVVVDQLTEPVETYLSFKGTFLTLDTVRERFIVRNNESAETYRGLVGPEALEPFKRASLSAEYDCELTGVSTIQTATGIEYLDWYLTAMNRADPNLRTAENPK